LAPEPLVVPGAEPERVREPFVDAIGVPLRRRRLERWVRRFVRTLQEAIHDGQNAHARFLIRALDGCEEN
jgi:hypothetical protein